MSNPSRLGKHAVNSLISELPWTRRYIESDNDLNSKRYVIKIE